MDLLVEKFGDIQKDSAEIILLQKQGNGKIEYIEMAMNDDKSIYTRIYLLIRGEWKPLRVVSNTGEKASAHIPNSIIVDNAGVWDVLEYDTNDKKFKFILNRELTFEEGIKITVQNVHKENIFKYGAVVKGKVN